MTLFSVLFGSPFTMVATAAGAVSVPIIIHLLNRKRFRIVDWAAMRFLLAAEKKNSRKLRIEQLLLLLVRALIVFLIVMAMASVMGWAEKFWASHLPQSFGRSTPAGRRAHRIIVIDGSFSMGARIGNSTAFENARNVAIDLVEKGNNGDGYTILLMARSPRRVIAGVSDNKEKIKERLEKLHLPHGNSDLGAALEAVSDILKQSPGQYVQKEVYFLTDLQQTTWEMAQPGRSRQALEHMTQLARAILVDVGEDIGKNLAITDLKLKEPVAVTGAQIALQFNMQNYGMPTGQQIKAKLRIGRAPQKPGDPPLELREVEERLIPVQRGQFMDSFTYQFREPGKHVVQIQLLEDRLDLDNARSAVLDVRDEVPVLIVNGKPAKDPYDTASELLLDAVDPYQEERRPVSHPFKATVLEAAKFADAGRGDLSKYDCVFFCDVSQFSPAEASRMMTHVKRRGGIVFCLGPQVDRKAYNEDLYRKDGSGLLPARLLGVQSAPQGYEFRFVPESGAFRQPPLSEFNNDRWRASLTGVPFFKYMKVKALEPREIPYRAPQVLLSFLMRRDLSQPAAGEPKDKDLRFPGMITWKPPLPEKHEEPEETIVRQPARGPVVLLTSTVNRDWTHWPRRPNYPWVIQELLRYATSGRLREQTYSVGQVLEAYLQGRGGSEAIFYLPDAREEKIDTLDREDFAVLRWVDTDISGIYRAKIGNSPVEHLFAVNVPAVTLGQTTSESDPTRTAKDRLESLYSGWDFQIVQNVQNAKHKRPQSVSSEEEVSQVPELGTAVAHWLLLAALMLILLEVVLAWVFGHYSAVHEKQVGAVASQKASWEKWLKLGLIVSLCILIVLGGALAFTLIHEAITGDFLGFLPASFRQSVEKAMGVPPPAPGESTRWELDYLPYLVDEDTDPWLAGLIFLGAGALVGIIYFRERRISSQPGAIVGDEAPQRNTHLGSFLLLTTLRLVLVLAMLSVLLPQVRLWFKRQSWPNVVIVIDDSASMSTEDEYRDEKVKAMAEELAKKVELTRPERLALAKAILTKNGTDWITELLNRRKVKVHLYRCSGRAKRLVSITQQEEIPQALEAISNLKAVPENDVSRLGISLRQIINDLEGHSVSGIILFTDGVTTEGETIVDVSRYAAQSRIPLFFVGIGDSLERRDIILSDLEVADSVLVNDNLIFRFKVSGKGYGGAQGVPQVELKLYEKGKNDPIAKKTVTIDETGAPVDVRMEHRPTKPGEKVYIIKTDVRKDEVDPHNNQLGPKTVFVHEAKLIKVLYVEGYGRWEYRYLKTLLERESFKAKNKKSIDLKVVLLNSDAEYADQDRSALHALPTEAQLNEYDVVILGDVDPEPDERGQPLHVRRVMQKMPEFLKHLSKFVLERGGGLVLLAGERSSPHRYKKTPLANVLPIEIVSDQQPPEPADGYVESFRPVLTGVGQRHPIFSFDEEKNQEVWEKLRPLHWFSQGYKLKPAAEVLAVHPTHKALPDKATGEDRHPLVVHHFVGAGRCLYLGIHETWRWRFREDEKRYNQFWIQTIRYLARSRHGRTTLTLDKQVPYLRGEAITVTVRFPDDAPPPPPGLDVRVKLHRKSQKSGEQETRTLRLKHVKGSRATFSITVTRTPEGKYRFWLENPKVTGPRPEAEALVLSPPGELEQLRMNEDDMQLAARETSGKFYSILNAQELLNDLPAGERVSLSAPGPPWLLWNHSLLFVFILLLLATEWILRKQRHLL